MSLEERVALLDSGFHPILSLSHGNPLHLHFETLLREDGLPRLLSRELRTLKMSRFGKKQDPTNSTFPKLHPSLLHASRSVFEGRRQLEGTSSHRFPVSSPQAHKYSSLHHPLSLHPETPPAPSSSQIPFTGSPAVQSSKSRKAVCSYDIDNIVIPMSMVAATRVEKPQYKEIVVPSWRIVELKELEPFNQADSELEDTSEKMYSSHHSKYEDLERACWDSWATATSHKRGSSQTRTVLSCSEGTRSSLEMLDEAVQNIQPWEPRTFPLSDSAYRGLLQHSNEDGYNQADFQPWVSSNKQGIRPTSVDTVIPGFTGMQFSDTHLRTDVNKSHREVHRPALQPRKAWQQH
nr:PREDICTED: KAT8 regulatory NSL complex subunit 1-like protein isoform X2 [Haliaeetus albicilla]